MITINREQCHLVDAVRRMGRDMPANRSTDWRVIARKLAGSLGSVTVWRCDDTMVVFLKVGDKVVQRSHKPNTWRFA